MTVDQILDPEAIRAAAREFDQMGRRPREVRVSDVENMSVRRGFCDTTEIVPLTSSSGSTSSEGDPAVVATS